MAKFPISSGDDMHEVVKIFWARFAWFWAKVTVGPIPCHVIPWSLRLVGDVVVLRWTWKQNQKQRQEKRRQILLQRERSCTKIVDQ